MDRASYRGKMFALVALCLGLLLLAGCGGSDSAAGCSAGESGESIDLENSGLTCEHANALVNVLPDMKGAQSTGSPGDEWICAYAPEGQLPVRIRCRQGQKRFTALSAN